MSALREVVVDWEDQEAAKRNKHKEKQPWHFIPKNLFFPSPSLVSFPCIFPFLHRVLSIHNKEKETLERQKKEL